MTSNLPVKVTYATFEFSIHITMYYYKFIKQFIC